MSRRDRRTYEAGAEAAAPGLPAQGDEPATALAALHDEEAAALGDAPVAEALAAPALAANPAAAPLAAPLAGVQGRPVARTSAQGSLARLQTASQALLATGAWRLRRVGSSGLVGIGLLVGAAVLYTANTLPQGKAIAALKMQLARLGPAAQGGASAPQVQVALGGLPRRDDASDVVGRIYEEAQAAGVELPRGQYEFVPARDGVAAHYRMTFPVHAAYPQLRNFMDRTLIALPSVAVEGLRIERKNVTDETVDAELKLSAFVRDGG
jgi:hypothetical protein